MDRVRIGTRRAIDNNINARQWAGVEKRVFAFAGTRYLNRFSLGRQYFTCTSRAAATRFGYGGPREGMRAMHDPALWITSWARAFGGRISPYFKNPARRSARAGSPQSLVATGRGAFPLCRAGSFAA